MLLGVSFLLSGCELTKETSGTDSAGSVAITTAAAPGTDTNPGGVTTDVPKSNAINPLTGQSGYNAAAVGKRPVAVMVNNLKGALPQYGVAQADMIYEVPVEGGITRLLAVYADYSSMPDVCSIRSCRYYYPILAFGMDAIYCHWGMDKTIAADTLDRLGIDRMDGGGAANGVIFFRDAERAKTYASEHTGYLKGSAMAEAIETKFGFRTETKAGSAFQFNSETAPVAPAGTPCKSIDVAFSNSYFSTFTYDAASKTYLKQHSGKPHMDGRANTQLAFTNVLALQTTVQTRADGYLMDVELKSGTGYYVSQGAVQKIKWSKAAENQPIVLTDEAGQTLHINAGKTYIGVIGKNKPISIE